MDERDTKVIGCFCKFHLIVGVEESTVNALYRVRITDQECYSRQVTFFFRVRICYKYECALLFGILGINYSTLIFVYEIKSFFVAAEKLAIQ
jgi:hypothetical protein